MFELSLESTDKDCREVMNNLLSLIESFEFESNKNNNKKKIVFQLITIYTPIPSFHLKGTGKKNSQKIMTCLIIQ